MRYVYGAVAILLFIVFGYFFVSMEKVDDPNVDAFNRGKWAIIFEMNTDDISYDYEVLYEKIVPQFTSVNCNDFQFKLSYTPKGQEEILYFYPSPVNFVEGDIDSRHLLLKVSNILVVELRPNSPVIVAAHNEFRLKIEIRKKRD